MVGIWSPHIIAELNRVLTLRWLDRNGDGVASRRALSEAAIAMMDVLTRAFELIDTAPVDGQMLIDIGDRSDHHLVHAARFAGAGFVVSDNTRDFPRAGSDGRHVTDDVEFLVLREFFRRFGISVGG